MARMTKAARVAAGRVRARGLRDRRMGSLLRVGTTGALGYARRSGWLDMIPEIMGSKLATIALVAGGGGYLIKGKAGERLLDVGEAAAGVALYQFMETGNTQSIAGRNVVRSALTTGVGSASVSQALRDLAEDARERADIAGDYDDEDDDEDDDVAGDALYADAIIDD